MKRVSELYGRHAGADIYVVGTGASVRVLPKGILDGKITIALNMAWKLAPASYAITIHPDLNVPEFMPGEAPRSEITWITGHDKARGTLTPAQFEDAERRFYFFDYRGRPNTAPAHQPSDAGRIVEWAEKPTGDFLYLWSSIAQAGVNLAANLGAKNVFLVGCDNGSLLENHHAHGQHTRWKGVAPSKRYDQYYEGLSEVRAAVRKRGVNVVSVTPLLGVHEPERDFKRLCDELGVPKFIDNVDVSPDVHGGAFAAMKKLARRGFALIKS